MKGGVCMEIILKCLVVIIAGVLNEMGKDT